MANRNQPSSDRLETWKIQELEAHIAPVEAVLRLLGMLAVSSEPQIANDEEPEQAAGELAQNRTSGNPTWVEAALNVLPENGDPLHAKEILRLIIDGGHRNISGARTPENTLRRDLRQESLRENPRIRQTAPSTFARA